MGAFTRFQRVTLLQSASDLRPEDAALQALCGSLGVDLLHTEVIHVFFNKHACSIMFQFDDFRHSNIMFHYRLGQPPVSDQRVCCVWIGFPGSGYGGRDQRWLPQISSQFHNRKVSVGTWGCSDHSEIVVLPDPCFLISSARAFCILLHLSQQKSFSFLSRLFWQVGKYTCKHYHSVVAKQSTQLRRYFTWAYLDVCPTMFVLYSNGSYNPAMMKPI